MSQVQRNADDRGMQSNMTMELPLFPLETVLFPGMVLPLRIFESRYREMVNYCLDEESRFGAVLIDEGHAVAGYATPHRVGTAARISRVERHENGQMDITVIGTQRFRIDELDSTKPFLTAKTTQYPFADSSTRAAVEMAYRVRPLVLQYVEILSDASNMKLRLDSLPEDPKALAILVAIALQVSNEEKQRLLEQASVPDILDRQRFLLSWEIKLLRHMLETQPEVESSGFGFTGYLFPN